MRKLYISFASTALLLGSAGLSLAADPTTSKIDSATPTAVQSQPVQNSGSAGSDMVSDVGKVQQPAANQHADARRTHRRVIQRTGLRQENQATRALNLLSANGYTHIESFKHDRNGFTANATKDGHSGQVEISPHDGQIRPLQS